MDSESDSHIRILTGVGRVFVLTFFFFFTIPREDFSDSIVIGLAAGIAAAFKVTFFVQILVK